MYTEDEKIAYIIKSRKDFKTVIIAETVLLVIGIIMIITVAIGHQEHNEFMQSAVSVEATCTRSWRDYEYIGNDNHIDDVYYSDFYYEYNGKEYTKTAYKTHMTVGKTYTIYVDKNNPEHISTESGVIFLIMYIGLSAYMLGIIISYIITFYKHHKFKLWCINNKINLGDGLNGKYASKIE